MGAGNFLPAHAQVTTQHLARSAKGCQLQGWLLLGASYAAFLLPTSMRQLEPQTTVHSILLLNGAPTEHLDGRGGGSAHSLMSHCLGPTFFWERAEGTPRTWRWATQATLLSGLGSCLLSLRPYSYELLASE